MKSHDDMLFVATHNDTTKQWLKVEPLQSIKIDAPMYFMQKSWDRVVFPVIEV